MSGATAKISDKIEQLKDYAEDSIPVLNDDDEIIGAITADDLIEAVDDEMGDDYAKLAGLTAEEDLHETLLQSMKKRMPWLVLLLGLGLVVSSVVGIFEAIVAQVAIVMCFQSLILDMAGNVGTQSLAVTIRVLMDENISRKAKLQICIKGNAVGGANRVFAWHTDVCMCRLLSALCKRTGLRIFLYGCRLCRSGAVSGDDHFEPDRYDHPDVFPQDQSRSGGRFRSADHDGKRSRGARDILWACRRVADRDASGWLRSAKQLFGINSNSAE